MAFYRDDEDELNGQGVENQGAAQLSPQAATVGVDGQSGAQGANAQSPDKSGNFVGIKQYLDANKNQASKLGDQTAGVINSSANAARDSVNALNQAADSSVRSVNSLSDDVKGKLSGAAETLSEDEKNAVKTTASAQYKGPKSETDLGDAYTNAAKASQTATQNIDKADTEEGRMGLIGQVNSKPRTQGMNVFDNALLQAGGGREKLSQASAANQDVKGALETSTQAIRNRIGRADDPSTPDVDESSGAIGQTAKAQADAYKSIQDAMSAWKEGFAPKVQQAQNDLVGAQNRITQDLAESPYQLNDETMALYGFSPDDHVWDVDLTKYLKQASPGDINASNIADATDYARYAALADLAGESDLILDPKNAALAGTAPKVSVDRDGLQKDIGDRKQHWLQQFREGSRGTGGDAYLTAVGNPGIGAYQRAEFLAGKSAYEVERAINDGSILTWGNGAFSGGSDPQRALNLYRQQLTPWIEANKGQHKVNSTAGNQK